MIMLMPVQHPTSALHLAQTLVIAERRILPLPPLLLFSLGLGLGPQPSSRPARMTMRSPILLTICTLSALLLVARGLEKPSPAPVVAVAVAAASDLIRSGGHRYLDVRTGEEFRNGHVEDSLNVPYLFFTSQGREKNPQFIAQVEADFDKEDNIVVGCKSGVRSELACADLMAAGFRNVKNVEGGYTAWVENGLAVKKSQAQDEL